MAKVKVSQATGPVLDWMVAKALGYGGDAYMRNIDVRRDVTGKASLILIPISREYVKWAPSTDWDQGGPIIEREGILLRPLRRPGHSMDGQWLAMFDGENTGTMVQWVKRTDWHRHYWSGTTPLIAAMRCYVASKMGDEVEIPEGFNHG